jgi:hypothetical protein
MAGDNCSGFGPDCRICIGVPRLDGFGVGLVGSAQWALMAHFPSWQADGPRGGWMLGWATS